MGGFLLFVFLVVLVLVVYVAYHLNAQNRAFAAIDRNTQERERTQAELEKADTAMRLVGKCEAYWRGLTKVLPDHVTEELTEAYKAALRRAVAKFEAHDENVYESPYVLVPEALGEREFENAVLPLVQKAYQRAPVQICGLATPNFEGIDATSAYINFLKSRPLVLPEKLRFQHTYIIGATGTGKTTLLKHLILHDIRKGNGLTIITPDRSFITDQLMPCLAPERIKDVIYFNPEDDERPVTFNPLARQPYENIDRKADELLTLFKRAIGDTSPRMDAILRNSFYALLERAGSTLNDMYRLLALAKPELRQEIIATTKDEMTRDFFQSEYPSYPKDAARPILNRLDALTRATFLKNALCQPKSTLNFQEAMNQKKIVLCNLSDGAMGTQNATLLGQLLIASIQQALFARDTQSENERVPHFLYIDEFETYTTASTTALSEILTRARKLKFGITMAHQHLKQIPTELLAGILGNASTKIVMRVSPDDAKKIAPHLLPPEEYPLAETLPRLGVGMAYAAVDKSATPLYTLKDDHARDPEQAARVMESSRERYGQTPTQPLPQPQETPPGPARGTLDSEEPPTLVETQETQYNANTDEKTPTPRRPDEANPYKLE